MPTITIRDLPDDVINIHKGMAAATDRSFEAHLRYVLREVIARQTFACDRATPIPFYRCQAIDYKKKFVAIFKEEPDCIEIPYRGLIWNAVYNWSQDEVGTNAPWCLVNGDKFFGMTVSLAPFEQLTPEQKPEVLGFIIGRPNGVVQRLPILLSEILDNKILEIDANLMLAHEPCGWDDIPIGRRFIIIQSMDPMKIGTALTKIGDVEAEKEDGSSLFCEPSPVGYGLLPE